MSSCPGTGSQAANRDLVFYASGNKATIKKLDKMFQAFGRKVYDVGTDQAWEIAKTVFRWEGTGPIEEHRSEGYMETSSGSNMMSYGTLMAAWVSLPNPESESTRKVTFTWSPSSSIFSTLPTRTPAMRTGSSGLSPPDSLNAAV